MSEQTLERIRHSMDQQIERKHYPQGFPALPPIPTARYYDPAFAAIEMRHLWRKTWLMVGVESELPKSGSYFLFEQLDLSVIITRDKDDAIKAFHNICSHRASVLLTEPNGKVGRFVCPYHAWTYALDGRLIAVPEAHEFACLDKSEHGLMRVRCETWRGLIFINLDPNADPLADFMHPAMAYTAGFPLENLVVQDRYIIPVDCNWKLAYHNFTEAYHTRVVHSETLAQFVDQRSWMAYLLDRGHARIAVNRTHGGSIYLDEFAAHEAIDDIFRSFGVCQTFFPNAFTALDPSGFALQTFWPAGTGKSVMEVRLVGWEPKGQRPEYWAEMRTALDVILTEDARLFASLQRNVESGFLPKIMLGYLERTLYWFEEELDRRIGQENMTEDMRVTPVLAGQVER